MNLHRSISLTICVTYMFTVISRTVADSPTLACNVLVGKVILKLDTTTAPIHGRKYLYIKGRITRVISISSPILFLNSFSSRRLVFVVLSLQSCRPVIVRLFDNSSSIKMY